MNTVLKLIIALMIVLSALTGTEAQFSLYEVYGLKTRSYAIPYPLVTLDTLESAETISDLNARFPSDWIKSYESVKLTSTCQNSESESTGSNDELTRDQLDLLWGASDSCIVEMHIEYIPQNNLEYNPARNLNYTFRIVPIYEAKFPGGGPALLRYLESNIMQNIPGETMNEIDLISTRFTIDKKGKVDNVYVEQICGLDEIEKMIVHALRSMPQWQPARNQSKEVISQEFQLNLGTDLMRCDWRPKQLEKIK